jgi:uncharacterized SAM-binding protein YcdF (DUF218 family)
MKRRLLVLLVLIWILGFAWFAIFLPQAADISKTDGVVVLTGGSKRIDRGLEIMALGKARRMLISGVDRDVKPEELASYYTGAKVIFACCVDLGFRAVDTRSNALETARWAARNKIKSIRLVTNNWHMRRARLELDQALSADIIVTNDAVGATPSLFILFKEYNKYWLRAVAAWVGI